MSIPFSHLTDVSVELEDAVNAMLSFQTKAVYYQRCDDNDHHFLDHDDENANQMQRQSNQNNSNHGPNVTDSMNHYYNHNHHQSKGKSRTNNSYNHRNRRCNTYERKRALRRLQRALISFEEVMDCIDNNTSRHSHTHTLANEDNHILNIDNTLNEWTLNILLDVLTEIPKVLLSYNAGTHSANTANSTKKTSSLAATTMMDQLYNQEIVTITCSIIQKYALLPLHESFIDRILDQIASFVSNETMTPTRKRIKYIVKQQKKYKEMSNDNFDDDNHSNVGNDDDDDDDRSLVLFHGQHKYFLNMVQLVNTSLLAHDQKLQKQQQIHQNENHRQDEDLQQQYCNLQNTVPIITNGEHGESWRDNICSDTNCNSPCDQSDHTEQGHDGENEKLITTMHSSHNNNNSKNNSSKCTGNDIGNDDDNYSSTNNSPSLLLLNANETIALTQLLIPLSLEHLSHSWEFCSAKTTTITTTTRSDVNKSNESDNLYQSQQNEDEHENLKNHQNFLQDKLSDNSRTIANDNNTSIRMKQKSNNQIIEIDDNSNAIHLEEDDNRNNMEGDEMNDFDEIDYAEEEENTYKADKDLQQESEIQLRVLLGYLFRHLTSLMPNGKGGSDTYYDDYNDDRSCISTSLEESLYQLFHTTNATTHHKNQHHHPYYSYNNNNTTREQKLFVEDYLDLVTSFLIESVEYAIDVMDNATHFLRNFISSNKRFDDNTKSFLHDDNGDEGENGESLQHNTLGGNDESVTGNILSIRCHVKDTIRHCSIAIGMIEIFYEDMKLHNISSNNPSSSSTPDYSHLMSLYKSYTEFVASFCTDELLHGTFCWSSPKDVEAVGDLFDSADNVLFRLSETVSMIEKVRKNKNPFEPDDDIDTVLINRGKKRRRVHRHLGERIFRFMDTATIVVFLRAFHSSKSHYHVGEENRTGGTVVQTIMGEVNSKLQHIYLHERNGISSCSSTVEFKAATETTNLIQACALSTLMLTSCSSDNKGNMEHLNKQTNEEHLLASLLSPLMTDEHDVNAKDLNYVIEPLNPWSYLLRTKIAEISPWVKRWNSVVPIPLPAAVSTSSISTVSDLKSNIASVTSSKSGEIIEGHNDVTCTDPRSVVSDFVKAIPQGFDTLEERD